MPKPQNFHKEKVQVVYTPRFNFARDASIGAYDKKKKRDVEAQKLISKLEQPADWNFDGVLSSKGTLERISKITYPRTNNGHQEDEGWGWQLDVSAVGSGSVDRLVLACKPKDITIQQKESGTVKVGTEQYKKIEATLTLAGRFRAIENVKKR
jgi:hypothetical protein